MVTFGQLKYVYHRAKKLVRPIKLLYPIECQSNVEIFPTTNDIVTYHTDKYQQPMISRQDVTNKNDTIVSTVPAHPPRQAAYHARVNIQQQILN